MKQYQLNRWRNSEEYKKREIDLLSKLCFFYKPINDFEARMKGFNLGESVSYRLPNE